MPRHIISTALLTLTLTPLLSGVLSAEDQGQYMGYYAYQQPLPYANAGANVPPGPYPQPGPSLASYPGYAANMSVPAPYPNLDAALYPCPRPDIPAEVGGTMITNSALYPHEMLYAHNYCSIYPPFYYKTKTQFGLYPCNLLYFRNPFCRKVTVIRGTEVTVKYHSRIGIAATFAPPGTDNLYLPYK